MDKYEYFDLGNKIIEDLKTCNKKIILYGTGSIGNYIFRLIEDFVSCYCVTDNMKQNNYFNGVPVYEFSTLPYDGNECKILLTLDSKHWNEVEVLLRERGYNDIEFVTIEYQNALLSIFYSDLFKKHSIDLEDKVITLNDVIMRNPFKLNEIDYKAVFIEMNDLVMGDILCDYSMWSEGPYQYGNVKLENGDVVLDCGANLGLFSCIAASKQCTSFAFEPTKRLYEDLKFYSELYKGLIIPRNLALSNSVGLVDLAISSEWDVANTIVNDGENTIVPTNGYDNFIKVETITVDEFVKKNKIEKVDFIKADIEGAERLMLAGAVETLAQFAPKLAICTYHFKDDPQVLEEIIKKANPDYIVEHKWKKLYAYVDKA